MYPQGYKHLTLKLTACRNELSAFIVPLEQETSE
jgi:hypothetical protein